MVRKNRYFFVICRVCATASSVALTSPPWEYCTLTEASSQTSVYELFRRMVLAQANKLFIRRESSSDKEFHFQNWVKRRLDETGMLHEQGGRNSYPDFRMVHQAEGYEIKGLAYPGRWINFDSNSQ